MWNSPEGWAINPCNLRALWWYQHQVHCLDPRDFRPDLDQKKADAIISYLLKFTESVLILPGYHHVNLGGTLLLTCLRMGGVFARKLHPHKSIKTTNMPTAVTWGYLMKGIFHWGGSYERPREKVGWRYPLLCSPSLAYLCFSGVISLTIQLAKDRFLRKLERFC